MNRTVSIRLPVHIYQSLKKRAIDENRSINQQIVFYVQQNMAKESLQTGGSKKVDQ